MSKYAQVIVDNEARQQRELFVNGKLVCRISRGAVDLGINGQPTEPGVLAEVLLKAGPWGEPRQPDTVEVAEAYVTNDPQLLHKRPGTVEMVLNDLSDTCHLDSVTAGWWDEVTEANRKFVVCTKIALIHSEVSEALEGFRKDLNDDHLPNRTMVEVELADTLIRVFDLAGFLGVDLGGAVAAKLAYNRMREDHKREVRSKAGGKSV